MMPKDVSFWWVAFVALTSHKVSSFLKYYYIEAINWKQCLSNEYIGDEIWQRKHTALKLEYQKLFVLKNEHLREQPI